jgi:hypothetical protein
VAKLGYGEAKSDKPGSFGIYTKYYDQGASTVISHRIILAAQGFKGYMVGANCAIFKNMVAALEYYDLKGKEDNEDKARTIWTELMVTF